VNSFDEANATASQSQISRRLQEEKKSSMYVIERSIVCLVLVAFAVVRTSSALAQQPTGTPGSPSATTTIDGRQLPPPPPKFGGQIERNAAQSKPYWPAREGKRRLPDA